jgi:hypothetical protein
LVKAKEDEAVVDETNAVLVASATALPDAVGEDVIVTVIKVEVEAAAGVKEVIADFSPSPWS